MRLTDALAPEHVVVPLRAKTVRAAVQALIQRLAETGAVDDARALDRLVAEEHIRDVIHVGNRVLLPHMRTPAVDRVVVALGIAPEPLQRAGHTPPGDEQVVVLVLAPPTAAQAYLQMVAALARALRHDAVVEQLLRAESPEEVLALPELRGLALQPRLTVRDVMTPRAYRVTPETPVREVLDLMNRHGLKAVPVVGGKREVLGMVTERDLLRHLLPSITRGDPGAGGGGPDAAIQAAREAPVRDLMSRAVMGVSEEQGIAEVASIMINKDVERLPVVNEGKLAGFLTRGDIIRKLFS